MALMNSKIFFGYLMHNRKGFHKFKFQHYFFAIDIDELNQLNKYRFFGWNRFSLFSLLDKDYLGEKSGSIREKLLLRLKKSEINISKLQVVLVTTPRFLNHTFNPLNFYYFYTSQGSLKKVFVEVNNTFGESHLYILNHKIDKNGYLVATQKKLFHVSPMNDIEGDYSFFLEDFLNTNHLNLNIDLTTSGNKFFSSAFRGKSMEFNGKSLLKIAFKYTFSTFLALPRILFHAGILHYLKKLPIFPKPDPSDKMTYTSTYKPYINEFKK